MTSAAGGLEKGNSHMIWLIHQFVQVVEVAKIGKHFEIRNPQSQIYTLPIS
jgi:hypothetical protein